MPDPAPNPLDYLWADEPPPGSTQAAPGVPPAQPKGIMDTSHKSLPSKDNPDGGGPWERIATAAGNAYYTSPDFLTPSAQASVEGSGWLGRNVLGPAAKEVGALLASKSGIQAGLGQAYNEALGATGLPANLQRDLNILPQVLPVASWEARLAPSPSSYLPDKPPTSPLFRPVEAQPKPPPTPSLSNVVDQLRAQRVAPLRATAPYDPTTQAAIDLLRRQTSPTAPPSVPRPPEPFTTTPGPQPQAQPPGGGLLNIPPAPGGPAPAIMTQAEIEARARGHFSPADQAAAQGAMLPDTNAAAVRKLFSDTIPSNPEDARIKADQPAVLAAKNVDPSGPMSYATAMNIDRNLSDRMRGASGSDRHELGQLQGSLRDQMDQVPDLDNLRLGRQAWTQSIKQGQMEDINYGASLITDDAKQNAYIRQRAAALLKSDSAMKNWTPDEKAPLEEVAKSGDIGALKNFGLSLIKPIVQTTSAGIGHSLAGVPGAIVGGQIGGEFGGNWQSKLRAALSKTTLDPVMQQISSKVPSIPPPPQGP
jgi:hypothetical protein